MGIPSGLEAHPSFTIKVDSLLDRIARDSAGTVNVDNVDYYDTVVGAGPYHHRLVPSLHTFNGGSSDDHCTHHYIIRRIHCPRNSPRFSPFPSEITGTSFLAYGPNGYREHHHPPPTV